MSTDIQNKIAEDVKNHKIIMYVKGSKGMPMCGFSKRVMDIFTDLGVDFETRDVLSDLKFEKGSSNSPSGRLSLKSSLMESLSGVVTS